MSERTDEVIACCPCLVLAGGLHGYAAAAGRALRRQGWDVYTARNGPEARRLARLLGADLVILDAELPGESGWLTCAKLVGELPLLPVVLVSTGDGRARRLAAFVGASEIVRRDAGMPALLWAVDEAVLAAAG
jgi:DNA-binding response OmpR family regulator